MMNLQTLGLAALLGFAGAVLAQTPSPSTETQTSPSQQQDTADQSQAPTTGTPPISDSDQGSSEYPSGSAQVPTSAEEDPASAESESTRIAAADGTGMSGKKDKHRVSKLIGKNVESSDGQTIGQVKDVVIDGQAKITHFILSHGRLGSTRLTAVPYDVVKRSMQGERIVLDRTRLQNAPSFEESNFPNIASSDWSRSVDRYWQRSRTAAADVSESGSQSGSESAGTESSTGTTASPDTTLPPSGSSADPTSSPSPADPASPEPTPEPESTPPPQR
jgi:sporulation protein YlmC with PRC-barrel domain